MRAASQHDLQAAGAAVSAAKRHIVEMADQAEALEAAADKLRRELAAAATREADAREEARVSAWGRTELCLCIAWPLAPQHLTSRCQHMRVSSGRAEMHVRSCHNGSHAWVHNPDCIWPHSPPSAPFLGPHHSSTIHGQSPQKSARQPFLLTRMHSSLIRVLISSDARMLPTLTQARVQAQSLSLNPSPGRQVVREDAARVQQLLRSQAAELAASQMLVGQLEAPPGRASAQQQELEDLRKQLQVKIHARCTAAQQQLLG